MHPWQTDALTSALLLTVGLFAARLTVFRKSAHMTALEVVADLSHLVMALSMIGMVNGKLAVFGTSFWEAAFTLMAGWFGISTLLAATAPTQSRSRRATAHQAAHLAACLSMIYMFIAMGNLGAHGTGGSMSGVAGMAGMAASARTLSTAIWTIVFIALLLYALTISILDGLFKPHEADGPATSESAFSVLSRHSRVWGQITANAAMAYMLIVML